MSRISGSAQKSRPKRRKLAAVRCHRYLCTAPGVVIVEAPCCGKSVLVCVNCAWEAMLEPSAELEVVA
jgi:hypothetical protein